MDVMAFDPDVDNGPVSYNIKSSNLYRYRENHSLSPTCILFNRRVASKLIIGIFFTMR